MNLKQFISSAKRQRELANEHPGARLRTTSVGYAIADYTGCPDPAEAWLRDCATRAKPLDDDHAQVRREQYRAALERYGEKPFRDERSGKAEPSPEPDPVAPELEVPPEPPPAPKRKARSLR